MSLYRIDHSQKVLTAAAKALSYLAKGRAGLQTVPSDHWALIATSELLRYGDGANFGVSKEVLIRHAAQICNFILQEQIRNSAEGSLVGAFDPDGRTAAAATRLEGLLAALEFLPKGALTEEIEAAAQRGIGFLLRAQITSGAYAGGLPGAVSASARNSSDVRIDYVQHALCAWLRYLKLLQMNSASTGRM
jgi:hypothetical protein